jgi:hypothetical protein
MWKVGIIVAASWVPIFIINFIKKIVAPSSEDKITH